MTQLNESISALIKEAVAIKSGEQIDNLDLPAVLIPSDFKMENIEHLLDEPARKRFMFTTNALGSFTEYCTNELSQKAGGHASCFVDPDELTAIAMFDVGTMNRPEHCENKALFKLDLTQEYLAILSINNNPLPQLEMSYWLEDWRDAICDEESMTDTDDKPIEFKKGLQALRKITFKAESSQTHEEQAFSKEQTGLARIAAESGTDTNLPARISFTCKPSPDLEEINLVARVIVQNCANGPTIKLQLTQVEKLKQDIAEQFRQRVSDELEALEMNVFVGSGRKH